ncbi:MAG: hypothetical protein KGY80_12980 [Candidatus Thorarchaeota archaeon]|nr:hypothetical protein [Candidatus Thorarchaeota archaeon]
MLRMLDFSSVYVFDSKTYNTSMQIHIEKICPLEMLYLIPGDGMPADEIERQEEVTNTLARPD